METCPACAAENPRAAHTCSACGASLGGEAAPARQMAGLLVDEAGELFEQGRYEEARAALSEALDIDRFDARARKLQWAVHLALEQQRADRDPAGALAEVALEIEQRLQGGDLRDASARLQAAQAVHGDQPRLHDLKARLDLLEVQQREAVMGMAEALTLEAERLVLEREYEQAESALREALELDPMNLEAAKLLGDVQDLKQAALPSLEEDFSAASTPPPPPKPSPPAAPTPRPEALPAAPAPPRPSPPEPRFLAEAPPAAETSRWLWVAAGGLGLLGLLGLAFCR